MHIKRCSQIFFNTIFEPIKLESIYLWKKGKHSHPMTELFCLTHQGRSKAVERALVDFGAEKSFERASQQFKEHYKWEISKSTVQRVTERIAKEAEKFLLKRIKKAAKTYGKTEGEKVLIVEVDGCSIRTGTLKKQEDNPRHKKREEAWKEVRIGFARNLTGLEKVFIGKMGTYQEVCELLFGAAVTRGLSSQTMVLGIADGGNGLKEELEVHFSNFQFILDQYHFLQHLYETSEALGYEKEQRKEWVDQKLKLFSSGAIDKAMLSLQEEYDICKIDRLRIFMGYCQRFKKCLNYDDYKEKGYPIGSGEIESAHRYIPQERLKLSGTWWHPENVNPMLSLRLIRANNWWNDFCEEKLCA